MNDRHLGDDAELYALGALDDDEIAAAERHLAVHEGHATTVTDLDRILVDAAGDGIVGLGWVAEADGIQAKLKEAEAAGSTEIIFAPSGPDIERELRVFAEAAGL